MNQLSRDQFNKCLNEMFNIFSSVAKVSRHTKEIEEYLEAHDQAKGLLSELAREDSNEFTKPSLKWVDSLN